MDRVKDLTLGNRLTAADDIAICRISADQFVSLLHRQLLRIQNAFADRIPAVFFREVIPAADEPAHIFADGRGSRESRGFDTGGIEEIRTVIAFAEDKIVMILMGAQACEYTDDLAADRQIFYMRLCAVQNGIQALLCRRCGLPVIDVDSCRTREQIAVHRRCHKDALAMSRGLREDCSRHEISHVLIHNKIIAAPRGDMDLILRYHVVERIGIHAGRVDDRACLIFAVVGANMPDALCILFEFFHIGIEAEVDTVLVRILRKTDRKAERADDAGRRRIERTLCLIGDVRLHGQRLFPAQKSHAFHTIGDSPVVQFPESAETVLIYADNQGSVPLKGNIQILRYLIHHLVAAYIHLRHHGTRHAVIAGMNDG